MVYTHPETGEELPIRQGHFEPAPIRKQKPMASKPRGKPGAHPHAPILDRTKTRRAIVKAALEDFITESIAEPREKAAARSLLREIHRVERERPDSTVCGILRINATRTSVWVYEKELAPAGRAPQVILTHNAYLDKAAKAMRS